MENSPATLCDSVMASRAVLCDTHTLRGRENGRKYVFNSQDLPFSSVPNLVSDHVVLGGETKKKACQKSFGILDSIPKSGAHTSGFRGIDVVAKYVYHRLYTVSKRTHNIKARARTHTHTQDNTCKVIQTF